MFRLQPPGSSKTPSKLFPKLGVRGLRMDFANCYVIFFVLETCAMNSWSHSGFIRIFPVYLPRCFQISWLLHSKASS